MILYLFWFILPIIIGAGGRKGYLTPEMEAKVVSNIMAERAEGKTVCVNNIVMLILLCHRSRLTECWRFYLTCVDFVHLNRHNTSTAF